MSFNKAIFKYLVYYPAVYLRGQNVPSYLSEMVKSQYMSDAALKEIQMKKLEKITKYAASYVAYYNEILPPEILQSTLSLDDLGLISPLDKDTVKSDSTRLQSKENFKFLTNKTTGGSTGQPVTIKKTRDAMARELAATWLGYSWAGIDIGDKQGRFWGVPTNPKALKRSKLIDFVTNRLRCSAFSFDEKNLELYAKRMSAFQPRYFYGYVSMLCEFAQYFRDSCKFPPFHLDCIITTSEVLSVGQRELLESVFSCRVYNEYGSGELGSVAHECEKGSLHVMSENMIVEVLDGDNPCAPGEVGELVITELNNLAMPLIRYRTGDLAALSAKSCECGRSFPVIEKLVGRAYDLIRNKQGKVFHGEFFVYIMEDVKRKNLGVGAFQIIQRQFDRFLIKVKPEKTYSTKTEDFIISAIKDGFDPDTEVQFEMVEEIKRLPSGKMRLVVGMQERGI